MKRMPFAWILAMFSIPLAAVAQRPVALNVAAAPTAELALYEAHGTWRIPATDVGSRQKFLFGGTDLVAVPGDFNGDGSDDIAVYHTKTGQWFIRTRGGQILEWGLQWGFRGGIPVPGDFNRDGRADLAVYNPANGNWYIRTLAGTVLAWDFNWGFAGTIPVAGDYNGDAQSDLAVYHPATGAWFIRSLGGPVLLWNVQFGYSAARPIPGDYNGDGRHDLVLYDAATSVWYGRTLAGDILFWKNAFGNDGDIAMAAEMDGNPGVERIVFNPAARTWSWRAAGSTNTTVIPWRWPTEGDFNGDGRADLILYNAGAGGLWDVMESATLDPTRFNWGYPDTDAVVADFTGNGRFDAGVYNHREGRWDVRNVFLDQRWGGPGSVSVVADYSGDGRADLAVYFSNTGEWYVRTTDGTILLWAAQWGGPDMIPVAGDFNGDGRADLAVFNSTSGRWFIRTVGGQTIRWDHPWGGAGMVPISGDFNRDGRHDLALFQPATGRWFIQGMNGQVIQDGLQWGARGMIPVRGDYNGDGRSDFALYEPETRKWFIHTGSQVLFNGTVWGVEDSLPAMGVNSLYIRWDVVYDLGPSGSYPVNLPYNQDWVIEADFIGMRVAIWDKFFQQSLERLQVFPGRYGRMSIRLANNRINFTQARVGSVSTPSPPDHYAWTVQGLNVYTGNHAMRMEYRGGQRSLKFFWDGVLVGDWDFDIRSMPSPIQVLHVTHIQGGQLRVAVNPF